MKQLVALAIAMVIAVSTNAANLNKVYEDDYSTVFVSEKSRSGDKVEAYVTTGYKQNMNMNMNLLNTVKFEYDTKVESIEFICSTPRKSKDLEVHYYLDREKIDEYDFRSFSSYKELDLSTKKSAIADFLCSKQ
ncbi:hypothetical protein [Psychrobacter aquimaris]|uniref:hypothetical protein n=1 Tax=Psychrobacter aquimaris TaxID=292733 RepID=UPI0039C70937